MHCAFDVFIYFLGHLCNVFDFLSPVHSKGHCLGFSFIEILQQLKSDSGDTDMVS